MMASQTLGQCTITLTSAAGTDNQTVCVNTAITDITYATTGAKGATVSPLPAGVKATWADNVLTISGTPVESGIFYYTLILKGGCGPVSATGSITVITEPTLTGSKYVSTGSSTTLASIPEGGTWNSDIPEVATVDTSTGLITGVSPGTSIITYSLSSGCSVSIAFNVLPSGWEANPTDYTYHGMVVAEVFMGSSIPVESGFLAAFAGNECRGIIESGIDSISGKYFFNLICFSNITDGDVMIFKYFDPAENIVYDLDRSVDFIPDMTVGESVPLQMNKGTYYSRTFPAGWSWFSVNTTLDNMTLKFLLAPFASVGDYIKSQVATATFYSGYGWFGSLTELEPEKLYKIKVLNNTGISFSGKPVDINSKQIPVVSGWNWIGYLPQDTLPVNIALSSLQLNNLDYIKNQSSSATYYSEYGWFGSLNNLIPNQGYMLRLSYSGILEYPDQDNKGKPVISTNRLLQFDPSEFEFNGSITAKVLMDGVPKGTENDLVYACVNNEIRGVINGIFFPPAREWIYPLMIHSNISQGEEVSFRYFDAENNKYFVCNETIIFKEDMIVSDANNPLLLHISTISPDVDSNNDGGTEIRTYPNPFEHSLNIEYNISEPTHVRITVFDIYGNQIRILTDQKQEAGTYLIRWDSGLPSDGTYFLKFDTGYKHRISKVILIR